MLHPTTHRSAARLALALALLLSMSLLPAGPINPPTAQAAGGLEPELLKDIYPGTDPWGDPASSYPEYLTEFNGNLIFSADDGVNGGELWISDGTGAGTLLLKDIYPGTGPWGYPGGSDPYSLTEFNGSLFFTADDGVNGRELWTSDGTADGTVLLKDIYPGTNPWGYLGSSDPYSLTEFNGSLFFAADDGSNGREFWISDGTAAGTVLLKDINSGSEDSSPSYLAEFNGSLFFQARDGSSGRELWISDGTASGTALLKDISPGSNGSYPQELTEFNGSLFFTADDGSNGTELWISDGTADGTVLLKDISPGSNGSYPRGLTEFNGNLFFAADDGVNGIELWISDGTAGGTMLFKDICPGTDPWGYPASSDPKYLTEVNGSMFFAARDDSTGFELWTSDGTADGTMLLKDIYPGTDPWGDPASSYPEYLTEFNGNLIFAADDGVNGSELWTLVTPTGHIPWRNRATGATAIWNLSNGQYFNTTSLSNNSTHRVHALADFDGDGAADDLLWRANTTEATDDDFGMNAFWLDATSGSPSEYVFGPSSPPWDIAAVADFDGDGDADILLYNSLSYKYYIWRFEGGTYQASVYLGRSSKAAYQVAAAADFDGDGDADILLRDHDTGRHYIWNLQNAAHDSIRVLGYSRPPWTVAGAGRFDGASAAGIVLQHPTSSNVYLWRIDGSGWIDSTLLDTAPAYPTRVGGVFDADADGYADMLWYDSTSGAGTLWRSNGTAASFNSSSLPAQDPAWQPVGMTVLDYDGAGEVGPAGLGTHETLAFEPPRPGDENIVVIEPATGNELQPGQLLPDGLLNDANVYLPIVVR